MVKIPLKSQQIIHCSRGSGSTSPPSPRLHGLRGLHPRPGRLLGAQAPCLELEEATLVGVVVALASASWGSDGDVYRIALIYVP